MYFPLSIHLPLLLNLENVITAHKQSGIFNGRNNLSRFFIRHIKDHFVYYIWVKPNFCQNSNQISIGSLSYFLAESGLHSDIVHKYLLLHHARCRVMHLSFNRYLKVFKTKWKSLPCKRRAKMLSLLYWMLVRINVLLIPFVIRICRKLLWFCLLSISPLKIFKQWRSLFTFKCLYLSTRWIFIFKLRNER